MTRVHKMRSSTIHVFLRISRTKVHSIEHIDSTLMRKDWRKIEPKSHGSYTIVTQLTIDPRESMNLKVK